MIGYLTLGTNDLDKAVAYYDELLAEIGAKRYMTEETFVAWTTGADSTPISISKPFNGEPATVGNGVMAAIEVDSKEAVDRVYAKAIAMGSADEGAAGPRGEGFYAGYFRDLDGNKLNVFCVS
ncbi:glyoxalase [Halioglobus japonicus]|uniref:VOC family protein n=2 Tax=Halioglobus TaxID=1217416 RepID=A0AAP8MH06_9GAMM|nr:VOC family protein [Halioglobus japonicus]AQA19232.1 glyoxalase [Halioglobus japonicus]PLW87731.1 VOC family protein [Halioglobus japonicus]GHD06891.1 glyoxalase [Halioglobus japonicus]